MMGRGRSRIVYLLVIVLLLSAGIVGKKFTPFEENWRIRGIEDRISLHLMERLVFEHHLPRDNGGYRSLDTTSVAYILGGRQENLMHQFQTVGRLYAEGAVRNILALHRPGITEYSPALGRNLSNDEWAVGKLKEEGVAPEDVGFVPIPPTSFDTFAEAREISALVRSRRVKSLILVSSMHHTKRVWLSFSHFNEDDACELYIYGSGERAGISELLMEYLKLRMYKHIVIRLNLLMRRFRG